MRANKATNKAISKSIIKKVSLASVITMGLLLSGCAKYGGDWDCGTVKGIGCSSIEVAERVARDQILLNTGSCTKKKIKIKEYYEGFKKVPESVVEVK